MHELGVVFYIIRDVKKVAEENKVEKVKSVKIRYGEVSGIIPEYLVDCWNWACKREPIMDGAELLCEEEKAITWCDDCKSEYYTIPQGKICPHCGSGNTWLKSGKDCTIVEVGVV